VGEIASEVSAAAPVTPATRGDDQPRGPGAAEEDWTELRRHARWLADRVRAEGFDD
jgi:hypothetical protein